MLATEILCRCYEKSMTLSFGATLWMYTSFILRVWPRVSGDGYAGTDNIALADCCQGRCSMYPSFTIVKFLHWGLWTPAPVRYIFLVQTPETGLWGVCTLDTRVPKYSVLRLLI